MKTFKKVLIILLAVVLSASVLSLFACDPTVKLKMSEIEYDDITKIVSWSKVANATSYSVRVGAGVKADSDITEKDGKMQFFMTEGGDGKYSISIIAKGNGSKYLNSDAKTKSITYTKIRKLFMNDISYDENNYLLTWDKVAGASGYELKINGVAKPAVSVSTIGNRVKHIMNEPLVNVYEVSVVAKGDGDDFSDSDPEIKQVVYTPIDWAKIREKMSDSLNVFINKESAFDYVLATSGGVIMDETTGQVLSFATFGLEMPSAAGDAYYSEYELFLLMNDGFDGKGNKEFIALPNLIQMFTMGGQIPENSEDVTITPKENSEGYILKMKTDISGLDYILDPLMEAVNGYLSSMIGKELFPGMAMSGIEISGFGKPTVTIEYDLDFNILNVNIVLDMFGGVFLDGMEEGWPIIFRIMLNFAPADREIPDDMYKYLEDNGYQAIDISGMTPAA